MMAISFSTFAQLTQGVNYQGVARDINGNVLKNTALSIRIGIYQGADPGILLWQEDHTTTTNDFGLFTVVIGSPDATKTDGTLDNFLDIDWASGVFYLETSVNPDDGNGFQVMGKSPVLAVPYAYYAGSVGNLKNLNIRGSGNESPDSALFEVKRSDGQTVFAVYPEGVRVYVDTATAKGPRGGFAIGGFGAAKGGGYELFRVTPDSIRIYLDPYGTKGPKGGFAIGGYGAVKGTTQEFLRVTPDSVRVYIDDRNLKGRRGGFAIGGFDASKGAVSQFFNVSGDSAVDIINPSQPRILWYPKKEAFLAGRVLIESPDSVGLNSLAIGYETKAIGQWSSAMGFKSVAGQDYSMSIGMESRASGFNSFALGFQAQAQNEGSYAFGTKTIASGVGSFAFGSPGIDTTGTQIARNTESSGNFSFAFGLGCKSEGMGSLAMGANNLASAPFAVALGNSNQSTGGGAVALGSGSLASGNNSLAVGDNSIASGYGSVAMGEGSLASQLYTFAMGFNATASGNNAIALGNTTTASGDFSFAAGQGSQAIGRQSVAFGGIAMGDYSMALGVGTKADAFGTLVLGRYNAEGSLDGAPVISPILWQDTDPVLVVGNGTIDTTGNALILYKNGDLEISGALTQASDLRMKKNISPLSGILEKIETIQPVYFEFKDTQMHPSGTHIGFIAQEIDPVFPELVKKNSKGYLSVDYPAMTAVLLQALKEQQKTISDLQDEIGKLKNDKDELAELKEEVATLKELVGFTTRK